MPKLWRIHRHDPDRVATLERNAGIPSVVAQLLIARGIDHPDGARQFLEPKLNGLRDPGELPGVDQAAELLYQAIQAGRRITVYGDYDADGMTATAILVRCLKLLHADVDYYVPCRLDEGYSLNPDALEKIKARGGDLVVTVDCGIASVKEAALARQLGLTLVVTDHHHPADVLPDAAAIVHPNLPEGTYPFPLLCGAAVALKLAWGLCQQATGAERVSPPLRAFLVQAVGLAAIGTVADVVPLIDENRILVRHGLDVLRGQPPLGVAALMDVAKIDRREVLDAEDLAFKIGPRLNAAGRMGQAELGVELLTTADEDRARTLATYVDELNVQRQSLERSVFRAADQQAREKFKPESDPALVLADAGWHAGIIGIVAGRLVEKYHLPVVMIAQDEVGVKPGSGSARSIPGFNLHQALTQCTETLLTHGGHEGAAGLRIDNAQVDAFRRAFCEVAAREISAEARQAELSIDAETVLTCLTRQTVGQIESLAPFGHGNHRPVLCTSRVRLLGAPKRIGSGGRTLSMTFDQHGVKVRAVAFGAAEWADELARVDGELSIAFRPVINRFRGQANVEIHLDDWRVE